MEKINGIVLRTVKFNDKRKIIDLFTKEYGRMSFIVPVKLRVTPLTFVCIDADIHSVATLQKISSINAVTEDEMMLDLRTNPIKSVIVMFISEFLANSLREESQNIPLYIYIENSLKWLNLAEDNFSNFHIVFLLKMSQFLGIKPNVESTDKDFFDLSEGKFTNEHPLHKFYLAKEEASVIPLLLRMNYENMHLFQFSRQQRFRCLEVMNDYFSIHIAGFPKIKSLEVLHSMWD